MMFKVYCSNFVVVGFMEEVVVEQLVELGVIYSIFVCEDLGSGCLMDLFFYGILVVIVCEQVEKGLDVVMFSGDKLLGGFQVGVFVGKKDVIECF